MASSRREAVYGGWKPPLRAFAAVLSVGPLGAALTLLRPLVRFAWFGGSAPTLPRIVTFVQPAVGAIVRTLPGRCCLTPAACRREE